MADPGGGAGAPRRRSRLADYADMADAAPTADPAAPDPAAPSGDTRAEDGIRAEEGIRAEADALRRQFTAVLEIFRDTAVLVPVEDRGWLTADFGGVRWILAFSDESALARYALARGEGGREWEYETVLGARLLDVAVPEAGVPCGVALDAADGTEDAVLFPPVAGIVPDAYAVNRGFRGETAGRGRTEERW
ncbi:hypothetical protein ABZ865_11450 [Streptomyces sp. NPDC047085]|uniref:hypothetical protein n=1 Tax=Streptomyces sp. NPDC047085 TaxID=3155140 RepID=UPI0034114B11